MTIEIKFEHNRVKGGSPANLGVMLEITAPRLLERAEVNRKPQAVVFVVDRSGSMNNGRLELVKQTLLDLVPRLQPDDYFSVVSFDDQVRVTVPMSRFGDLNVADIRSKIAALDTGNQTNIELGLRYGLAEAVAAPEGIEAKVVLLSDGKANKGIKDVAQLGELVAAAREFAVSVSTLGIGQGYDERILDALSIAGHGNHFAAVELAEAVTGLSNEFDGLIRRSLEGINVEIELLGTWADGRSSVRATQYLRKFKFADGIAIADLGDLTSGEERNFVFDLNLAAHEYLDGASQRLVRVAYEYFDISTGALVKSEEFHEVHIEHPDSFVEPERDVDIVSELQAIRAQDTKEHAIELMRQGRETEAKELMERLGIEFDSLMNERNLSPRARSRMQSQYTEVNELKEMFGEEFIKRGTESVNRGRSSKPDPRKKD